MMEFTVLKTILKISPLFFAMLTLFLLVDKNGIASVVVLFSVLHETGHFLALLCVKTRPKLIEFSPFGIHVSLPENLSTAEKVPVLMAGFSINFLLAAIFFILRKPLFGYINLIIGIFTALPISATDGGAVLKTLLYESDPQKEEKIFKIVSCSSLAMVSVVFIISAVVTKNYFFFIPLIYMVICAMK